MMKGVIFVLGLVINATVLYFSGLSIWRALAITWITFIVAAFTFDFMDRTEKKA
jgi:hypothetical protein